MIIDISDIDQGRTKSRLNHKTNYKIEGKRWKFEQEHGQIAKRLKNRVNSQNANEKTVIFSHGKEQKKSVC
jgi:hypothetical protein